MRPRARAWAWWSAALLLAASLPAGALSPAERQLLEKSIRKGQVATVETATGGLDALPLLTLDITVDLERRSFTGEARLDWRNTTGAPVKELPVRLESNGSGTNGPTVAWVDVKGSIDGGAPRRLEHRPQSATVTWYDLPAPLAPLARVVLTGTLGGKLDRLAPGATDPFQASLSALFGTGGGSTDEYGTFACGDGLCTLTGFSPVVPAFIDGRFDTKTPSDIGDPTYSDPQNLLLSVVVPAGALVAATGREVGRVRLENGEVRTSFAMAATRDVGLVVSRAYAERARVARGVRVESFFKATDRRAGLRALSAAVGALETYDREFGRYPWSVLKVAESALVGGAGGVELPALTLEGSGFYRRPTGMLALADPSGRFFDDTLQFIVRHEVAHEWWYAQVGSHPQRYPFIDEPLAQWSALVATRATQGEGAFLRDRSLQVAMNFQALALLGHPDGVVARPAGDFPSMIDYAGLVYGKAPLFYEAVERAIGRQKLARALRSVVEKWRFKRITPGDLEVALVQAGGEKVAKLWRRWFYEKHGNEDLGPLDLSGLLGAVGGPGSLSGLSLGALSQALGGSGLPGGGSAPVTPDQVQKLLRDFQQQMNDADQQP